MRVNIKEHYLLSRYHTAKEFRCHKIKEDDKEISDLARYFIKKTKQENSKYQSKDRGDLSWLICSL